MNILPLRYQGYLACGLAVLMALTRAQHPLSLDHLPESSWAVFLLAGVYVRSPWVFVGLLAEAALLDWGAIALGGVSSFCVSIAYAALLPAYGALWGAGRWYARHHRERIGSLLRYSLAVIGGAAICELISSGSFYFFSGQVPQPTPAGFIDAFARYFPHNLGTVAIYAASAALVHFIVRGLVHRSAAKA
jgi:hypothetical protein